MRPVRNLILFVGTALLACNGHPWSGNRTGLSLSVVVEGAGASLVAIVASEVPCDGELGGEPRRVAEQWSVEPGTLAAADFLDVPAGCWRVDAVPLQTGGVRQVGCNYSRVDLVQVKDGWTTEVLLRTTCDEDPGPASGAVLNQAPRIRDLEVTPSRWIFQCEPQTICVTAEDQDGDAMRVTWSIQTGPPVHSGPTVVLDEPLGAGLRRECVELVAADAGDLALRITIHDLFDDGTTVEDWLVASGYGSASHEQLDIPVYVSLDDDFRCWNQQEMRFERFGGMREVERAPGCFVTEPDPAAYPLCD